MHWWTVGEVVVVVVGYVWSWRYQTGGRYLLIDLDTENEPTGAVTLTVLSPADHHHLGQGGRHTVLLSH